VVSHYHPDHYGLLKLAHPSVPVYLGVATQRILKESMFFTPMGLDVTAAGYLDDRQPMQLGPFRVTPYLVDHSAFDAYALLVEADGRRLFYSGDLRAHGRKAGIFEALVSQPPPDVDVLLLEGTHIRATPTGDAACASETELEHCLAELFRDTGGMVLAYYSAQNIDRLVTLFKASRRAKRDLVLDLYTAGIAAATGRETIPQVGFDGIRVFLPQSQRRRVIEEDAFDRVGEAKKVRIYLDELAERRAELVVTTRGSTLKELGRAGCLAGAHAVWSMWRGYLEGEWGSKLRESLKRRSIPLTVLHASGHAGVPDLQRLASAIEPDRTVPIHSDAPQRYGEFFERVEPRSDGVWWKI